MIENIIGLSVLGITFLALCYLSFKRDKKLAKNKPDIISFKETMELTDLPIITFRQGDKRFNFLLDTGSTGNHISKEFVDNGYFEHYPLDDKTKVSGMEGNPREVKYCGGKITLNDKTFVDAFMINDLSIAFKAIKDSTGANIHGILGTSFMTKYKYVIDFNKYVAYSKK